MRVNNNNPRAWTRFDPETVANRKGGVAHGASIAQNLRAMGEDTLHAVIPLDRTFTFTERIGDLSIPRALAPLGLLVGLFVDVVEILILPFALLKNLIDILGHAGGAAVNLAQGEKDGASVGVRPFNYTALPSGFMQFDSRGNPSFSNPMPRAPFAERGVRVSQSTDPEVTSFTQIRSR